MSRFRIFNITIHIAGWLLFMAFPLLFINGGGITSNITVLSTYSYWLYCATYIILFYINGYILIPKLFFNKKYVAYTAVALVLLGLIYIIKPYDMLVRNNMNHWVSHNDWYWHHQGANMPQGAPPMFPPDSLHTGFDGRNQYGYKTITPGGKDKAQRHDIYERHDFGPPWPKRVDSTSLFIFLMIMAISTAIKVIQQWQLTEQRATQAEADKASAELSFLKAQINPHFLFNTLNNIYTLAVTHDDNAADSIMKLSNIMRYVTDDVTVDFVPLQSEVDCISDYIELQRLRMNDNTPIDFTVKGNLNNKKIPPLVLMTFIENVFKYGISKHEPSGININIDVSDSSISFFCQNKIFVRNTETRRMGIGIQNTKQRLEHLYNGRYMLYITNDDDLYTVQLVLQN